MNKVNYCPTCGCVLIVVRGPNGEYYYCNACQYNRPKTQ